METIWSHDKHINHYDVPDDRIEQVGGDPTFVYFRNLVASLAPENPSLLDVGCAAGFFCGLLKKYQVPVRYTGVDLTPEFIERARARYPEARFETSPADALPFPDASFDLVMSKGTMFVVEDMLAAVDECLRVCRRAAVMDFVLTPPGEDDRSVSSPERGRVALLGEPGRRNLFAHLKDYRVDADFLNLGLVSKVDLHPAYEGLECIRHLVLTVRKKPS